MNGFIEKNKVVIGIWLLFLVLASGWFLLYKENYWKPSTDNKMKDQESRIADLESKLESAQSDKTNSDALVDQIIDKSGGAPGTQSNDTDTTTKTATTTTTQPAPAPTASSSSSSSAATSKTAPAPTGPVNINTASVSELDSLKGIGPVLAQRIVDYRTANGPFQSIDDIKKVSGIGDKTFLKFKDDITI